MNPRANIIVFGLWDGLAGGRSKHKKHSHGKTMGYLFNDLVNYLKNSDIGTDVDIKFVDLMVDNMDDYYRTVKMIYD
ncbi:MAG TPA: hypothetical protein DD426_07635, partial [Clostridiaceae bacterium]|nr:hypothetical protein [Clostridiaceae bacterium]